MTCIEDMLFDGVCWVVVVVGETVFAPEIEIEKIVKTDMVVRRSAFPFSLVIMAVNHQAHCAVTLRHFKRACCDRPAREHQMCTPKLLSNRLVEIFVTHF